MNETRQFLSVAIASGLDFGVMTPDDVIRHISMDVLAHHLPVDLKTRLLSAALQADAMTAELVLDTLGVDVIAEHAPAPLLWGCIAESATKSLGGGEASTAQPAKKADAESPARKPTAARKPNRSTRAARVRAGATSRPMAVAPSPDDDDSPFDVDTRVGAEQPVADFDVVEESSVFSDKLDGDDVTSHGREPS